VFTRSADHLVVDAMRSTTLFRICQEALTNVVRHANATRVDVDLRGVGTHVVLTVRDNGRGISKNAVADPRSLGLVGMRERVLPWGGNVRIRGVRGKGTVVTVRIPVTEPRHGFQEESHDQSSDRR
jgi:signal transduction histidine kinase